MAVVRALCVTPRLTVHDITCRAERGGKGAERGGEATHIVFVRQGVFAMHVGGNDYIVDPCTAAVSWHGWEYSVSHPGDSGDDCTVLELSPELSDAVVGHLAPHRDVEMRLSPRVQAAYAGFLAVVKRWRGDPLICEESALELARTTVGSPALRGSSGGLRAVTLAALELLNDEPTVNHSVSTLSDAIGCSPGYLMHAFRAQTGTTLRRYRLQLRVSAALHRLAAGHDDLAALAVELGFASHAHLTDTLSRMVGVAPREIRRELAGADRGWVRRFLEASQPAAI